MRSRRKKSKFPVLLLLLVISASSFCLVCVATQMVIEQSVKEKQSESVEEQLPEKTPEMLLAEANEQYVESVIQENIQWAQLHGKEALSKQILAKSANVIEKRQKMDELKNEMEVARQKAEEEKNFMLPEFEEAQEKWREASSEYNFARNELYNMTFEIKKQR